MRRALPLILAVAASACAGHAAAAPSGAVRSCGSLTVGPTALKTGSSGPGATCLLANFAHCLPATYSLSMFGVDTIRRSLFTIAPRAGACSVTVTQSFRVVPRPAKQSGQGTCAAIVRSRGDIVAKGCHGAGLASTMSLLGRTV